MCALTCHYLLLLGYGGKLSQKQKKTQLNVARNKDAGFIRIGRIQSTQCIIGTRNCKANKTKGGSLRLE